jgi:hypothetical protein
MNSDTRFFEGQPRSTAGNGELDWGYASFRLLGGPSFLFLQALLTSFRRSVDYRSIQLVNATGIHEFHLEGEDEDGDEDYDPYLDSLELRDWLTGVMLDDGNETLFLLCLPDDVRRYDKGHISVFYLQAY